MNDWFKAPPIKDVDGSMYVELLLRSMVENGIQTVTIRNSNPIAALNFGNSWKMCPDRNAVVDALKHLFGLAPTHCQFPKDVTTTREIKGKTCRLRLLIHEDSPDPHWTIEMEQD